MQHFANPRICRSVMVGLAVALAVPIAAGFATIDPEKRARALNRPLAEWPTTEEARQDPIGVVGRLADMAADRSLGLLTSARWLNQLRYETLGDPGGANVVRNGDFVFLTDHDLNGRPDYRAIHASCAARDAERSQEIIARAGVLADASGTPDRKSAILVVPSKPVLYADRLPVAVPADLRDACMEARADLQWAAQLRKTAAAQGFLAAYPFRAFDDKRDKPHFYPPENFHTAGWSAHFAAWFVLNRLYPGEFVPGSPGFGTVRAKADMPSVYLYDRDIQLRTPRYGKARATRDKADEADLQARYPEVLEFRVWRSTERGSGRTAVVIGNSFSLYIAPHLAVGFDRLVLIYQNRLRVPGARRLYTEVIPEIDPDAVIYIHHDAAHMTGRAFRPLEDAIRINKAKARRATSALKPAANPGDIGEHDGDE
ncbi:MAG: hypothetical protein AAGC57_00205 [Pseudomonadota bacterium]